jgi:hypothetical protein
VRRNAFRLEKEISSRRLLESVLEGVLNENGGKSKGKKDNQSLKNEICGRLRL